MAPTLPLSRHIFEAPTYYYKTGIAFLSWLCGHQPGFTMVGGLQSARSAVHLGRLFALANDARLLPDPELAAHRMRRLARGRGGRAMSSTRRRRGLDVPSGAPARVAHAGSPATRGWRGCRSTRRPSTAGTLREAIDGCVAAGLPAIGAWREPVAEVGLETAAGWVRDAGLRVSSVCRGGFFTAADPVERASGTTTTGAPSTRRPRSAPRAWCWCPGGLPAGDRDLRRCPGASRGRGRGPRARTRCDVGVRLGHRADAPDLRRRPRRRVHARRRPSTSPSRCPSRRSASSSTPSTSGGSPASRSRSRGRATASRATRCASGSRRCPPDALLSRGMMGDGHIDFARPHRLVAAAGYARRRRGRDLQRRRLGRRRRRRPRHARAPLRRAGGAAPLTAARRTPLSHLGKERENMHHRRMTTRPPRQRDRRVARPAGSPRPGRATHLRRIGSSPRRRRSTGTR